MDISTQWVKVEAEDVQIDAYRAEPKTGGPFPSLIILQEIFGINEHIRDVTERFAACGFVAIAPAVFQRMAPGFEAAYDAEGVTKGREYKDMVQASQALSDAEATIKYLNALDNTKPSVGCVGFCFGGHLAYLLATMPEIKASAAFYGGGIPTLNLGSDVPTIARTPKIQGKIHLYFGTKDGLIPAEHVSQIETELTKHNIAHKIFRYPVGHGFFCNFRADYDELAAADAWQNTLALFDEQL